MPKSTASKTTPTSAPAPKNEPSLLIPNREEKVILAWAKVKPVYDQMVGRAARKLKLDGFRKGKVPLKIALPYLNQNELIEATINELLPESYQQLIADKKLRPITHPEVVPTKVEFDADWEITFTIAEIPELDIKGYEKVVATSKAAAASHSADHDSEHDHAKTTDPKTAPADKKLDAAAEREHQLKHIFNDLVRHFQPAVPELLVKRETSHELQHLARSLNQLGVSLEQYMERRQMKAEQLTQELAATSMARLQLELLLETISVQNKLAATDAEVAKQLETIADPALRAEKSADSEYRLYVRSVVTRQKTIEHVLAL